MYHVQHSWLILCATGIERLPRKRVDAIETMALSVIPTRPTDQVGFFLPWQLQSIANKATSDTVAKEKQKTSQRKLRRTGSLCRSRALCSPPGISGNFLLFGVESDKSRISNSSEPQCTCLSSIFLFWICADCRIVTKIRGLKADSGDVIRKWYLGRLKGIVTLHNIRRV